MKMTRLCDKCKKKKTVLFKDGFNMKCFECLKQETDEALSKPVDIGKKKK